MDTLDEPVDSEVVFRFTSLPLSSAVRVPAVPVWTAGKGSMEYFDENCPGGRRKALVLEDDLDACFFCMNLDLIEIDDPPEARQLPRGFYCNQFLKLNPLDIQEFLSFQRDYGMVHGARETMPFGTEINERLRPIPDGDVFSGINKQTYPEQYKGILVSQAIFDSVPDEEYLDKHTELVKLSAVSFREAIAAVLDAQQTVRDVLRIRQQRSDAITKREAIRAFESTQYISLHLKKVFPAIELLAGPSDTRVSDLITAVFAQLANALLTNETYRTCENPECQRLFIPSEMGRRSDTRYCSSKCQERAKRLRYVAKHAKRKG